MEGKGFCTDGLSGSFQTRLPLSIIEIGLAIASYTDL
jgi:hypothetical protein